MTIVLFESDQPSAGFEHGDSILAPGGSVSNMYALMIARHKLFPQHKKYGMRAIKGQLIMYTSQHVSNVQ